MLSKEEIETCKEEARNYIEFMETAGDNAGWVRGLLWYIEQLELDKDTESISNIFTKEDIDRIVKETREIERKAEKYDLLIEKLEKESNILNKEWKGIEIEKYAKEILEIVKGEKNE